MAEIMVRWLMPDFMLRRAASSSLRVASSILAHAPLTVATGSLGPPTRGSDTPIFIPATVDWISLSDLPASSILRIALWTVILKFAQAFE